MSGESRGHVHGSYSLEEPDINDTNERVIDENDDMDKQGITGPLELNPSLEGLASSS